MKKRKSAIRHKTKEVQVRGELVIDGNGKSSVATGVRFLDHMLELFAKHGLFDLKLSAKGDVDIDLHHTNEDIGLSLGEAFKKALGDKKGIKRMGSAFVPMDETLARVRCVADISGRPYFALDWAAKREESSYRKGRSGKTLAYDLDDARHFLESFVNRAGLTVHVDVVKAGGDIHHLLESIFKAFGRALRQAVEIDPRVKGVPSTKGKL
jgi:imidazoleglycerol-phosphate dehydratase